MRVAVCFSGQPRSLQFTLKNWLDNVLTPLECDVFCHFWNQKSNPEFLDNWARAQYIPWTFDRALVDALHADKLVLEDQKDFRKVMEIPSAACSVQNTLSMLYSIAQSNRLKIAHEEKYGFKYDVVVRARTDSRLTQVLDLSNTKENAVYVEHRGGPGDQFAFGSSKVMDVWTNCYYDLPELLQMSALHPETYFNHLMVSNGFEVNPLPFSGPELIR